jgi:hypothetical protein
MLAAPRRSHQMALRSACAVVSTDDAGCQDQILPQRRRKLAYQFIAGSFALNAASIQCQEIFYRRGAGTLRRVTSTLGCLIASTDRSECARRRSKSCRIVVRNTCCVVINAIADRERPCVDHDIRKGRRGPRMLGAFVSRVTTVIDDLVFNASTDGKFMAGGRKLKAGRRRRSSDHRCRGTLKVAAISTTLRSARCHQF